LGVAGFLKKFNVTKIWLSLFILQLLAIITNWNIFNASLFYLQANLVIMLALMFFTGVLVQHNMHKIRLEPWFGLTSLVAFWAISTLAPKYSALFAATLLAYSIFALGSLPYMSWFGRRGDFSYGIYIYSFPIQQMLVAATGIHRPYRLFLVAMLLSTVVGALSWHTIESRALRLKAKINLKKYPIPQTDAAW
jgi:hypothetical protein